MLPKTANVYVYFNKLIDSDDEHVVGFFEGIKVRSVDGEVLGTLFVYTKP